MKIKDLRKQDEEVLLLYRDLRPGDIFEFIWENNTPSEIYLCLRTPKAEMGDIWDISRGIFSNTYNKFQPVRLLNTELIIHGVLYDR